MDQTETAASPTSMHDFVHMPVLPFYSEKGITIFNADSSKLIPWFSKFDLLLTDPPYGIEDWNNRGTNKKRRFKCGEMLAWDFKPRRHVFEQCVDICKSSIVWGANHFIDVLPFSTKQMLVWDKNMVGMHFNDCEIAWTHRVKEANRIFRFSVATANAQRVCHPTEKPVCLMRWCLSLVPDANCVFDPFMGSGTTLVAAKLEGRQAVGIEINEKYCEAAAKRLSQGVLF